MRLSKGLTRDKVSEAIQISSKYLYEIEFGKANFSISIFLETCNIGI